MIQRYVCGLCLSSFVAPAYARPVALAERLVHVIAASGCPYKGSHAPEGPR